MLRTIKVKRIKPVEDYCVDCGLCEVACITYHSQYKNDPIKAFKYEKPRPVSRTKLYSNSPVSISVSCRHCVDAACMEACITGAIYRDLGTGHVKVNPAKCVGCWNCVMACPYGAIHPSPRPRYEVDYDKFAGIAVKCDLCSGRETPACVEACPNGALKVEEFEIEVLER